MSRADGKRPDGRSVLVSHPGGQHVGRLVEALHRAGFAPVFHSGIYFSRSADAPGRGRLRRRTILLNQSDLRRHWLVGILLAVPQRLIPASLRMYWNHSLWWLFDRLAARDAAAANAGVVTCFENSALASFRAAKAVSGARCVLECPSVHHSRQLYEGLSPLGRRFVRVINARKDEEIALADRIVVLSSLAKRTFVDAGVPSQKIEVIPLGVDLDFFAYRPLPASSDGVRFLFVGAGTYAKGVDVLVSAFRRAGRESDSLRIVGVPTPLVRGLIRGHRGVELVGTLGPDDLRDEYASAHVLILPSRFDGFGMVVTEALSTGRPVVVSSQVGAADLVVREGPDKCGWVIPSDDVEALAQVMREAASDARALPALSLAARRAAERVAWRRYDSAVERFYDSLLAASHHRRARPAP